MRNKSIPDGNRLSIEEIRRKLNGSRTPSSSPLRGQPPPDVPRPALLPPLGFGTSEEGGNVVRKLASQCQELLVFCTLMDQARQSDLEETARQRAMVRELEKFYDAVRKREDDQFSEVKNNLEKCANFEKKYQALKQRAQQHLRETQEERDAYYSEAIKVEAQREKLSVEVAALREAVGDKESEISQLKALGRTEKEMNSLNMTQRRLQNAHGNLATERAKLQRQLDELSARAEFGPILDEPQDDGPTNKTEAELEIAQLKKMVESLTEEKERERLLFEEQIEAATAEGLQYAHYAEVLKAQLEGGTADSK